MKTLKSLKKWGLKLWQDESGQGTAEYALILVAVVGLAFMFRTRIKDMLQGRLSALTSSMGSFNVEKQ